MRLNIAENTGKHVHLFKRHQALGCLFVDHAICLALYLLFVCKCKAKNIESEDMNVTDCWLYITAEKGFIKWIKE